MEVRTALKNHLRLILVTALTVLGLNVVLTPVTATAATPPPDLDLLECLSDSAKGAGCAKQVQGLYQPTAVAASPDGRSVYVVTSGSSATGSQLTTFDRNPTTGALTFRTSIDQRAVASLNGPTGVVVSPDGRNVYVSASSSTSGAVTVFARDRANGALTFRECWAEKGRQGCQTYPDNTVLVGARGIAVSDSFVYVTAYWPGTNPGWLTVMDRDPANGGRLTPRANGSSPAPHASGVAVSPVNFGHVYVTDAADRGAVRFFRLDGSGSWAHTACWTGRMSPAPACTPVNAELQGARGLAVSADERWIFVASDTSGSLSILEDTGGQNFTARKCWSAAGSSDCTRLPALKSARSVAVTADTTSVYVAASPAGLSDKNSLIGFAGGPTGGWKYDNVCWQSGTSYADCTSLPQGSSYGANGVATSNDGGNAYLLGYQSRSNAITVFDRGPHLDYPDGNGRVGFVMSLIPHVHDVTQPETFTLESGSLPAGLTLNAQTGEIGGIPTAATSGPVTATVRVTGGAGETTTAPVSITVSAGPVAPSLSYPDGKGRQGEALDPLVPHTSGLTGTLTYSLKSGTLPTGVTLNSSTGVISGTPTNAGSFTATVRVTNGTDSAETPVSLIIKAVTAGHLDYPKGQGQVDQKIDPLTPHTLDVPNPQTYSVTQGTLPDGLRLDSSSGVISGTPTQKGNDEFTVTVTGGDAMASAVVDIDVSDQPLDPALSYPDGRGVQGQQLVPLDPHTSGLSGTLSYRLVAGDLPQGTRLNPRNGEITGKPYNTGSFTATVKVTGDEGSATATVNLQIRKGSGTWTKLKVKAVSQHDHLAVRKATKAVKKVTSNGTVRVTTRCIVNGAVVNKYCRTKVSKKDHVTVTPRCNAKVYFSVTIVAKKPGAQRNKWQRVWKVDPTPRVACKTKGTG